MSISLQNLTLREMIEKSRLETAVRATSKKPIHDVTSSKGLQRDLLLSSLQPKDIPPQPRLPTYRLTTISHPACSLRLNPTGQYRSSHRSEMGTGILRLFHGSSPTNSSRLEQGGHSPSHWRQTPWRSKYGWLQ